MCHAISREPAEISYMRLSKPGLAYLRAFQHLGNTVAPNYYGAMYMPILIR